MRREWTHVIAFAGSGLPGKGLVVGRQLGEKRAAEMVGEDVGAAVT
jgi:hypothetical protein